MLNYYRLHGAYEKGRIIYKYKYSEEELKEIAKRVKEWNKKESYVYFNNVYMCDDAKRFAKLLKKKNPNIKTMRERDGKK